MDTKLISKWKVELLILCVVKRAGSRLGKSKFQAVEAQYKVADGNPFQVLGQLEVTAELDGKTGGVNLKVVGIPMYLN